MHKTHTERARERESERESEINTINANILFSSAVRLKYVILGMFIFH